MNRHELSANTTSPDHNLSSKPCCAFKIYVRHTSTPSLRNELDNSLRANPNKKFSCVVMLVLRPYQVRWSANKYFKTVNNNSIFAAKRLSETKWQCLT